MQTQTTATLPENASIFTRIRIGIQALQVLKDNAADPVYGPLLVNSLDLGYYHRRVEAIRLTAEGRKLLSTRPSLQGPELPLAELEALPAGSLGHEFARYFRDNKIEPFVTIYPIDSDVDYMTKRHRETHDVMHVVTGYATDALGEMELQAFLLGNLRTPSSALILAFSSPLYLKLRQVTPSAYFKRLIAAFKRGRRSKDLFTLPYEDHWQTPVAEISARYCALS